MSVQQPSIPTSGQKIDALLAAFSAGSLSPAMHALIASHLLMSGRNRGFAAALDDLQGKGLSEIEPLAVPDRQRSLAAIFESPAPRQTPARHAEPAFFPAPLARFIGHDLAAVKWRSRLPGLKEVRIASEAEGEACLYWIKAGRKMPFHTHGGSEATLVLQGAFRDASGHYQCGDVAIADADIDHQPIVDTEGDCICFAVTDAPLRLTGPVGRIVERLFGHRH